MILSEIFLYLRQHQPLNDWRAVVIYPNRSVDTGNISPYQEFFASQRVRQIYLNELGNETEQSIGISTIKLVVLAEAGVVEQARSLIDRIRQEITDELQQRKFLELLETLLFYKLPNLSREEIEAVFGLSELKQTRVYQEALHEGEQKAKLQAVPRFLALGLSVEQIAEGLGLSVEEVRQAAQQQPSSHGNI